MDSDETVACLRRLAEFGGDPERPEANSPGRRSGWRSQFLDSLVEGSGFELLVP